MRTIAKINIYFQQLPQPFQVEVLNFVEILVSKLTTQDSRQENLLWSQFSIAQAMHDLEHEEVLVYNESDLKERWH